MTEKSYEFQGKITRLSYEKFTANVIYIPDSILRKVPPELLKGRPRVIALLNGMERKGALQPAGEGTYYFYVSKALLKELKLKAGSQVSIKFSFDDPDAVDVPPELEEALAADEEARKYWDELSPGRKRGFAHLVSSAKLQETRDRRAMEVIDNLLPLNVAIKRLKK